MKCPSCYNSAVYQLDNPRGAVVCVSCGAISSWVYVYHIQSERQANADRATLEQLAIDLLRAKMAGKFVPVAEK